jgi:hypothetical protein
MGAGRIRDLTGQRFGRLVASCDTGERKRGRVIWLCRCDCGREVSVRADNLRSGSARSCGCLQRARLSESSVRDLTGGRFGRLTALHATGERRRGCVVWHCRCDCGREVDVVTNHLMSGNTRSCGCLGRERSSERERKDLTGQRFGRLVALHATDKRVARSVVWHCRCDCGREVDIATTNLTSGHTRSCGCLGRERSSQRGKELAGQRFGRLLVLHDTGERGSGSLIWRCRCDCGAEVSVRSDNLRSGNSQSCGCLRRGTGGVRHD